MCLVVLTVSQQPLGGHNLFDGLTKVLYTTPLMIIAIYAPICAMFSIVFAVAAVLADRFKALWSQRARVVASSFVCALAGLAFGWLTSAGACHPGAQGQNINCDLGLWVGMLSFAVVGALAGMAFALIYRAQAKN